MSSEAFECSECGRTFDTKAGRTRHHTVQHKARKWLNEDWLREQYIDKGKTAAQIADEQDVNTNTITNAMEKSGVEKRDHGEQIKAYWQRQPVSFYTISASQGAYEYWKDAYDGQQKRIQHHRLLAVAEYGFDALKGKDVHHKNGISWDNRPENIELLARDEHAKLHSETQVEQRENSVPEEHCNAFREKYPDTQQQELAAEYDYSKQTVWRHVNGHCRH